MAMNEGTDGALSKRLSLRLVRAVNLKLLVLAVNPTRSYELPPRTTGSPWPRTRLHSWELLAQCYVPAPREHFWGEKSRIQSSSFSRYLADWYTEQEGTKQKTRQLSAVHPSSPTLLEMKLDRNQNVSRSREFAVLKFI